MEEALEMNVMRRFCVGDCLRRSALRYPKREALIYSFKGKITHRLTYDELNKATNRFANALAELGIKKGDRIAIMSHNCAQFNIFEWALAKMGAWVTPLNFDLRGREITDIINHAQPIAFFVEDSLIDHVKELQNDMPSIKYYGMINLIGERALPQGWLDFAQLCSEKYSDEEPFIEINGDNVLTLMYTSGTEALPKGVLNTHGNWYSSFMVPPVDIHIMSDDTIIVSIPLYHVAAIYLTLAAQTLGARLIMHYEPDPQEILQLIQGEKINFIVYPPTVFVNILKLPVPNIEEFVRKTFASVNKAVIFGAPLPEAYMRRLMELLPNVYWMNYYGQSELTPLGTTLRHPDMLRKYKEAAERFGSAEPIGQPHLTVEMKIFDDNDNEVSPGTLGEMVVRSPSVMAGYYKEEEKTKQTLRGGWHHTGDLAIMDEEGYFYFADRKKDIVKTGGENVSTVEVETVIFDHPKVVDATVVGLPHPKWVEGVTAFVVPKSGESITEEEIIEFCKERLAGYKVPKKVVVAGEVPKNPSGKVLKKDLRKQFQDLFRGEE
jgi:fatty-acyl-CoA synthase